MSIRVVPPETFWLADWMIWPTSTFFSMTVPLRGARIVTSPMRSSASSRLVRALTRAARALAASRPAFSNSCSVTTLASRSSALRWSCAWATLTRASATSRSAWAWARALRTSRGSISAMSVPRSMRSPVSTCRSRISPDAFDLTSTTRIGSTRPAASTRMSRSPRSTAAVSRSPLPGSDASLSLHARATAATRARSAAPTTWVFHFVITVPSRPAPPARRGRSGSRSVRRSGSSPPGSG